MRFVCSAQHAVEVMVELILDVDIRVDRLRVETVKPKHSCTAFCAKHLVAVLDSSYFNQKVCFVIVDCLRILQLRLGV